MLGILIGIAAVIWLVAVGEGVSYQAQQQIKDLGANNIIVRSVKPAQTSSKLGIGTFHSLWCSARRLQADHFEHSVRSTGGADAGDQARGPLWPERDGSPAGRLHARVFRL